jgi:hypothetical protein
MNCEFLTADRWKVEEKRRIVGHGGCGAPLIHGAICVDNDLLREARLWRYSCQKILRPDEFSGLNQLHRRGSACEKRSYVEAALPV